MVHSIITTTKLTLKTDDPDTLNWPPNGAFLQIGMNIMSHARQVDIRVNDIHRFNLLASPIEGKTDEKNKRSVATIRLLPHWLNQEQNFINLSVREIPGTSPTNSMEIWWVALLVE